MLDLALHHGREEPVALSDIAHRQGIPLPFLEQIFTALRRAELVAGTRGRGGGYRLRHSPSDVAVTDIIHAVDREVDTTRCGGQENCQGGARCLTHDLWTALGTHIREFLDDVRLSDLAAGGKCENDDTVAEYRAGEGPGYSHRVEPPSVPASSGARAESRP